MDSVVCGDEWMDAAAAGWGTSPVDYEASEMKLDTNHPWVAEKLLDRGVDTKYLVTTVAMYEACPYGREIREIEGLIGMMREYGSHAYADLLQGRVDSMKKKVAV